MAAPFGHGFVGMAIARRMGVRSPVGLVAAFFAASLPDVDVPIGAIIGKDIHRGPTHTPNFALTAGMLAGMTGILAAESVEGERDLIYDALTGAAVVGSHVVLDGIPFPPEINIGPRILDLPLANWVLDAILGAAVAYAIWPKGEPPEPEVDHLLTTA
ncbi:MAG TPA: metal-dependent hydrolase [Dehalococcoidia bacterium]|nr:metal-dependent hydrolase [Dehalococcoidia bacterium]